PLRAGARAPGRLAAAAALVEEVALTHPQRPARRLTPLPEGLGYSCAITSNRPEAQTCHA
ncbi:MAG: hypothetical protein ACMG5Z_01665, partial [Luteimonas sp.]